MLALVSGYITGYINGFIVAYTALNNINPILALGLTIGFVLANAVFVDMLLK